MPLGNNFQHAPYSRADPGERVTYGEVFSGAAPDSPAWQEAMAAHGQRLANAGVRLIVFVHGAAVNTDVFGMQRLDEVGGLKRGYSRGIAGLDALLAMMRDGEGGLPVWKEGPKPPLPDDAATQAALDAHTGDAANFSSAYVSTYRAGINRHLPHPIQCARVLWSSEHHHLGRMLTAIQLLERFHLLAAQHHLEAGARILVHAHGQAGLVFALISNLLASTAPAKQPLLHVLKEYGNVTGSTRAMQGMKRLTDMPWPHGLALDVVTYGTPVRYGWDPSGVGRLLHIVNHRPMRQDGKRWLAKMELPQITMEMPLAWGGDYVQQLAVAGSDALPGSPDARAANKALWEVLEPYDGFERWLECVRKAVRCQTDGRCLLVDYKDFSDTATPKEHLFGHAAYTRTSAMLFNTSEIVHGLYAS